MISLKKKAISQRYTTTTNTLLKSLKPTNKPYVVKDTNLKVFIVRVNTSGKLVYMGEYARAKRIMLGRVGIMSLTVARDKIMGCVWQRTIKLLMQVFYFLLKIPEILIYSVRCYS